jgi:hypothetical protein
MLEDCCIWDMLLSRGGVTKEVQFAVVTACMFSRRRCISKRNSHPEEGSAPSGVCSSDIEMSLDEVLVDRLWGMLLSECGRMQVEGAGIITDCLMVTMV